VFADVPIPLFVERYAKWFHQPRSTGGSIQWASASGYALDPRSALRGVEKEMWDPFIC